MYESLTDRKPFTSCGGFFVSFFFPFSLLSCLLPPPPPPPPAPSLHLATLSLPSFLFQLLFSMLSFLYLLLRFCLRFADVSFAFLSRISSEQKRESSTNNSSRYSNFIQRRYGERRTTQNETSKGYDFIYRRTSRAIFIRFRRDFSGYVFGSRIFTRSCRQ